MRARQCFFHHKKAARGSDAPPTKKTKRINNHSKDLLLFLSLYILGAVPVIVFLNALHVPGKDLFLQYLIRQRTEPNWPVTFSTSFMAQLLQILAIAFCGCCTVGGALISTFFFCKGAASALFWLIWTQSYSWQGLCCYWALFWLPDALLLCGMMFVARTAQQASRQLTVPTAVVQPHVLQSCLLNRTIFAGLSCIPCSGLSVLLAFIFTRFLGL